MASLGSVLKTVGRGAMKGVLGFDDRDVRSKLARRGPDKLGKVEQAGRDYGFSNLNPSFHSMDGLNMEGGLIESNEGSPEDSDYAAELFEGEVTPPVDNFGQPEIGYGVSAPGLEFGQGGAGPGDPTGKRAAAMAGPRKVTPGMGASAQPKVGPTSVGLPPVTPGLPSAAPPGLASFSAMAEAGPSASSQLDIPSLRPMFEPMGKRVPGASSIDMDAATKTYLPSSLAYQVGTGQTPSFSPEQDEQKRIMQIEMDKANKLNPDAATLFTGVAPAGIAPGLKGIVDSAKNLFGMYTAPKGLTAGANPGAGLPLTPPMKSKVGGTAPVKAPLAPSRTGYDKPVGNPLPTAPRLGPDMGPGKASIDALLAGVRSRQALSNPASTLAGPGGPSLYSDMLVPGLKGLQDKFGPYSSVGWK